jgi:hypothetical protein
LINVPLGRVALVIAGRLIDSARTVLDLDHGDPLPAHAAVRRTRSDGARSSPARWSCSCSSENLAIKPATTPLLRRFGFRPVLIAATAPPSRSSTASGDRRA